MNKNLLKQIILYKSQFKEDFGMEIVPKQNSKIYHYFEVVNNTKIVSKAAMKEIYQNDCIELFDFFRSNNKLLPELINETEHFLIFEYLNGEVMINVTKEDFDYLEQFENLKFYPFINSLYSNLIRTSNGVKLIDLKHLDNNVVKIPKHILNTLIVYMNNDDKKVSTLFIRNLINIDEILDILNKDYNKIKIVKI